MVPSGISEIMRTVQLSRNSIVATPAPTMEIKSLADLVDLDSASIATLSRDEATGGAPHRGLYDFSEVAGDSRAANKGGGSRKPKAIVCAQRVMVQSQAVSCNVVKAFVQRGGR